MKNKGYLGIILLIVFLSTAGALASTEELQSVLDDTVESQGVPGIQATIIFPSGEVWNGVSGSIDRQGEIPLETSHILRMGSITKTYVATIIMGLVEEGLLSLSDPLSYYFPDFPRAQEVTVYSLLNHTSGIFNYNEDFLRFIFRSIIPSRTNDPEDLLAMAERKDYYHQPGTSLRYSNTNYVLLGLIAQKATGFSIEQLLEEKILHPLGLTNTYLLPVDPPPKTLIQGYDRDIFPIGTQVISPDNRAIPSGAFTAGAMASTTQDLASFLNALFCGQILQEETVLEMISLKPHIETNYGLGIFTINEMGLDFWGHNGAILGFKSFAFHSLVEGYTIAIMGNLSLFNAQEIFSNLLSILLEE